ncbi:MAG: patatin-like phospholipase family protein [Acidimicrobiia bacterium]
MTRIGLVLGGGGITGASYQLATLMALELACGWDPNTAEVVVGTSGGAYVTAIVRSGKLDLDSMVRYGDEREDVAERIRHHVFLKQPGVRVGRWLKEGILPGLRRPGLSLLLGSPARYDPAGLADWVVEQVGEVAYDWPDRPTVITAYDLTAHDRVAFGTVGAPDVALADAVAASSAIPLVFHPYEIGGRDYVDGGVASGTHADLVLGAPHPLDLIIVIAPMAALEERQGAWMHERVLDRVGRRSLEEELDIIAEEWPQTETLILRPSPHVLQAMRPNPMAAEAAVPTFIRTLGAMKRKLAQPGVWEVLARHCLEPPLRSSS